MISIDDPLSKVNEKKLMRIGDPAFPPPLPSPPRFPWATLWGLGISPPSPAFSCGKGKELKKVIYLNCHLSGSCRGDIRSCCWWRYRGRLPLRPLLTWKGFQLTTNGLVLSYFSPSKASSRWGAAPPPPRSRLLVHMNERLEHKANFVKTRS